MAQVHVLHYRTYKQDCSAAIKVKLSGDKKALEVVEMIMDHNHEINRNVFLNLPQQRKMNDSVSYIIICITKDDLQPKYLYYLCICVGENRSGKSTPIKVQQKVNSKSYINNYR